MKLKTPHIFLAGIFFTLSNVGAASAGGIFTPIIFIGGNDQMLCIASNVSTQPVTVNVRILGFFANSDTETCTLPANDKFGCQAFLNDESGQCRITISGLSNSQVRERVRGVMFSRITTAPFTVDSVVQAE